MSNSKTCPLVAFPHTEAEMNALCWSVYISTRDLSACIFILTFARAVAVPSCICKCSVFHKTPCQACTLKRLQLQVTALNKRDMYRDDSVLLVCINSQRQMWVTIKQPPSWGKCAFLSFHLFPFSLSSLQHFLLSKAYTPQRACASTLRVSGSHCRSDVTISFILPSALAFRVPSHLHSSVLSLSLFLSVTGGTWHRLRWKKRERKEQVLIREGKRDSTVNNKTFRRWNSNLGAVEADAPGAHVFSSTLPFAQAAQTDQTRAGGGVWSLHCCCASFLVLYPRKALNQ